MNEILKIISKDTIEEYVKDGKRTDGRGLLDYRNIELKQGVIKSADGSAWIKLGDTEVIVGTKFVVGTPYPDSPDEGSMSLNLELSGIASPDFETGPPSIASIEYGRVVDRVIRSAECMDFKSFCLVPGEKVLMLFIDCYPINAAGNLIDAAEIAAVAALLDTKFPKIDENNNIVQGEYIGKLEVNKIPISITFEKIAGKLIVDPNDKEEYASDTRFTLGIHKDSILACQKSKAGSFTEDEINYMIDVATSKYSVLEKVISDANDNKES